MQGETGIRGGKDDVDDFRICPRKIEHNNNVFWPCNYGKDTYSTNPRDFMYKRGATVMGKSQRERL